MSKKIEGANTDEPQIQFNVMPGADAPEEDDAVALDLSFEEAVVAIAEEAEEEETVAEVEEAPAEEPEAEEEIAEEEPQAEAPEAEEEEEPVEKASKKPMVPKARLDEVLAKQKALQKQLDEINAATEKTKEAPESYDFDSKEVEYQNMVLDGETDKAVALRREIRKAERTELEYEMRQEMSQTVNQDRQMTALQHAANAMEESYPVFDSSSDTFNEEYTKEVVELRDMFMTGGYEAVDALSKAVKYVVKDRDLDGVDAEPVSLTGKAPKPDELSKKRAQVTKKLAVADAQPPELPGESSSSHGEKTADLTSMTEEEFAALPEATLRRLRGDIM